MCSSLLLLVRSWAKSERSWFWSWCRACWTELWTPTCCRGKRHLWILRSRWSPVWRRGLSTTGYRCLSVTAKHPVKTSSGKLSPPANSAEQAPGSSHLLYFFPPSSTWTVVNLSCTYHLHLSDMQHWWTSLRQCVCLNINHVFLHVYNIRIYLCICFFPGSRIKHGDNVWDGNNS